MPSVTLEPTIAAVRGDGRQRDTRCPAHDDGRASLSVGRGDDGSLLLHCHAGCTLEAILAGAGLTTGDLFPETPSTTKPQIIATYSYRDEGGRHVYDVCRFNPKDFRQRRADGAWSLNGVRRVLYHLDKLQGQTTAYVVEGEKDAERLRAIGLPGTCNPGGAGKWRDEYAQQLRVATVERVVILPDHDEPGRLHAAAVARSCTAAGLTAKIVPLPDLRPKGDVSDWLDAGHTRDDLAALVTSATIYDPATAPAPIPRRPIVTFLSTVQAEPVDWVWPGRFARGKYTLIAGEPGLGKTYTLLDTSARISRGTTFPDGSRAPLGRVLALTAEDGLADTIKPRIDSLGGDSSQIAVLEAVREPDGTRSAVSLVRDLDMLAEAVREVRPIFVWIDPLSAYLGRTDTHRDAEVRSALAPLLDMANQERFALGAICHLSKDAQKAALHRPGGSIAFVAAARIVLALAADPNDPARRLLAPIKSNICRPAPTLAYRITDDRLVWEADAVEMDVEAIFRTGSLADREDRTDAERVISDLLADEGAWPIDAKHAIEAGQAHGIPDRTMRYTARKLGIRISRSGFGGSGKWLWYRPEPIAATHFPEPPDVAPIAPMGIHSEKREKEREKCHRGNGLPVLESEAADGDCI